MLLARPVQCAHRSNPELCIETTKTMSDSRIRELLGIDKVGEAESLTAQLRRKARKIGQEEKVAAVMMTSTLLETYRDRTVVADSLPVQSVPVPLAPPPPPIRTKVETTVKATAAELEIAKSLITDVMNVVTVPFLLRMTQTFAKGVNSAKGMSIHRSALSLLWQASALPDQQIAEKLDACIDTLIEMAFASSEESNPVPQESVERILDILKNLSVSHISRINVKGTTARKYESVRNKILQLSTKVLNAAVINNTTFPTTVLHNVVEIYNYFHYYHYRFVAQNSRVLDAGGAGEEELSVEAKVQLAIAVSRKSSMCLRQLIIQGLHGYASDNVRDTTLQACYFLLKESTEMMRPFEIDSEDSGNTIKYESLVPVLWSVEPDDGTNIAFGNLDLNDGDSPLDIADDLAKAKTAKAKTTEADKSDKSKTSSPPVGQFAVLLSSIIRIELRLLFQQALASLNDIASEDGVMRSIKPERNNRLLQMSFMCLSIFDQMLILLVGNNTQTAENEEDDDASAIWCELPFPVLARVRQYIHSIIHDMFEFIEEAAVMIQAQHDYASETEERHSSAAVGSGSGLAQLMSLCSRVSRSLSLWILEDEDLLVPILCGLNYGKDVKRQMTEDTYSDRDKPESTKQHVMIDSILCCSSIYHASIEKKLNSPEIRSHLADDDLVGGREWVPESQKCQANVEYHIDETMMLAQFLCGGNLSGNRNIVEESNFIANGTNFFYPYARYTDEYDHANMDLNYAMGQGDIIQFFLPVFLSITQRESQSYQEGETGPILLLPQLAAPACEFTATVLKLAIIAVFTSQSTLAGAGSGLARLYTSGSMACEQLSILLEHFMTEQGDSSHDGNKVLGVATCSWLAFMAFANKALRSENRARHADSSVVMTLETFLVSLKQLHANLELLARVVKL